MNKKGGLALLAFLRKIETGAQISAKERWRGWRLFDKYAIGWLSDDGITKVNETIIRPPVPTDLGTWACLHAALDARKRGEVIRIIYTKRHIVGTALEFNGNTLTVVRPYSKEDEETMLHIRVILSRALEVLSRK